MKIPMFKKTFKRDNQTVGFAKQAFPFLIHKGLYREFLGYIADKQELMGIIKTIKEKIK